MNLRTGKPIWSRSLARDEQSSHPNAELARSGDTVVAATDKHPTTAYRVHDGAQIWTESAALYGGQDCSGADYTDGHQLVRVQ